MGVNGDWLALEPALSGHSGNFLILAPLCICKCIYCIIYAAICSEFVFLTSSLNTSQLRLLRRKHGQQTGVCVANLWTSQSGDSSWFNKLAHLRRDRRSRLVQRAIAKSSIKFKSAEWKRKCHNTNTRYMKKWWKSSCSLCVPTSVAGCGGGCLL